MNTYLTVMVTVLVATQIIRITQNAIQLHHQEKKIEKAVGWIKDNDVSEHDFEIQRAVYMMLYEKLTAEAQAKSDAKKTEEAE